MNGPHIPRSHLSRRAARNRRIAAIATVAAVAAVTGAVATAPVANADTFEDVIAATSFDSYAALESEWKYLYPWGSDHNGSARMYGGPNDHSQISLSGGVLTLRAGRTTKDEGKSSSKPNLPIRYRSGAVHAKDQITVSDTYPNYEVKGEFQAPTARGTWPAFWLTAVNGWPPESDILEFKGDSTNWFNTFRTSSDVSTTKVNVGSAGSSWHEYRAWITKVSPTDVEIHYYVDGGWKGKHRANFVGKPMWLIINLQMEGSSGSPGPDADTTYRARKVYVGRSRAA